MESKFDADRENLKISHFWASLTVFGPKMGQNFAFFGNFSKKKYFL